MDVLLTEVAALKKMHAEDTARIADLEKENQWLKKAFKTEIFYSRQSRIKPIEKNVMMFPLRQPGSRDIPQEFKSAVMDDKVHQTLGVAQEECHVVDRGVDSSWVRVRLTTMARKRQVLKFPTRSAVRQAHKMVVKEELLPEETAERAYLKHAMDLLYQNGFHPFWSRGHISWWKDDAFVSMTVFDVVDGMSDSDVLAKARILTAQARPARNHVMDTTPDANTVHGVQLPPPPQVNHAPAATTPAQA